MILIVSCTIAPDVIPEVKHQDEVQVKSASSKAYVVPITQDI